VLKLGLLDEIELHIVPVILGAGMRLLGPELYLATSEGIELTPARVIATPDVTHIRGCILGGAQLTADRGHANGQPAWPRTSVTPVLAPVPD
jgi:hypothetical protein